MRLGINPEWQYGALREFTALARTGESREARFSRPRQGGEFSQGSVLPLRVNATLLRNQSHR